ncbi:MAG: hypothetical protein ACQEQT_08785 [Chloroflexota bacterium]
MKKRVWLVLLALGLVFGLAACDTETAAPEQTLPPEATATPETEEATPVPTTPEGVTEEKAGGDAEQPAEVSMGTFTGSLDEGEEGWYTFEVADGQVVSVDFTPGEDAEPMNVRLLDPEEDEVWRELGVSPTVTKSTRQLMSSSSGGMYYIRISEGHGEYTVELATESQDDAGSGGDAGGKVADALEVEVGQSLSGEIGDFDEEDWYTFEVADGQAVSVDFTPGEDAEPMNVRLLDPEQDEVWRELGVSPTVTKSTRQMMSSSSGGMYYIRISEGHGEYTIELAAESQDDAGSGGDAGDKVADALEVEVDQTFSGEKGDFDQEDWYTFEVADGQAVSVDFTPGEDAESMNVQLLDSDQDRVWRELGVSPTVTKSTRQLMSSSSGGMYYIQVSEGYGEYAIELAAESQDDAGSGGDAGDKVADALEVDAGQSFSGEIGEFDQEDWYTFEVTDGQVLSVDFTPGEDAEPMNVQLLNSDQDRVWRELGVDPTVTKSVERTEDVDGTYYVQVSEGNGSYTIEIE